MERSTLHKRVIGLDVHQAQITACALLVKRGDYYRDSATSHEALSVKRNASRWIKILKQFGYIPAAS
jgi:hypothetical protein